MSNTSEIYCNFLSTCDISFGDSLFLIDFNGWYFWVRCWKAQFNVNRFLRRTIFFTCCDIEYTSTFKTLSTAVTLRTQNEMNFGKWGNVVFLRNVSLPIRRNSKFFHKLRLVFTSDIIK